jgi:hypothetical protein
MEKKYRPIVEISTNLVTLIHGDGANVFFGAKNENSFFAEF